VSLFILNKLSASGLTLRCFSVTIIETGGKMTKTKNEEDESFELLRLAAHDALHDWIDEMIDESDLTYTEFMATISSAVSKLKEE